jgi:hypothetical protein
MCVDRLTFSDNILVRRIEKNQDIVCTILCVFAFYNIVDGLKMLVVPGGYVSCIANMEDQDYTQQCVHSFTLRQGVAQKILEENSSETKIKEVSTNCCEDASIQSPKGDFLMPSSELKVVSHYPKDLLSTTHGMLANAYGKKAQPILQISPEHVPKFILYESPLDMFKSHRIYFDLITANGVPDKLITCSHVINPF